jgi:hypothetical protein
MSPSSIRRNDLGDGSVDAVVCRFGIMLMPAPETALRHARRALRDGGRAAYAVWGPPDRNPWLAMLAMAVVQNGHQPPGDPFAAGGVFSLAEAARNVALLESAGFADVRVDELPGVFRYESFDDYWTIQTAVSGPLAVLVSSLPPEEASAIRSTVLAMVTPFESNGGYEFPSLAIGATARWARQFRRSVVPLWHELVDVDGGLFWRSLEAAGDAGLELGQQRLVAEPFPARLRVVDGDDCPSAGRGSGGVEDLAFRQLPWAGVHGGERCLVLLACPPGEVVDDPVRHGFLLVSK